MALGPDAAVVEVQFYNDRLRERTTEAVTPELASLFSYAEQFARESKRSDPCTLTFSSMLAAMIAGASPLCRWLERHLGLRGVEAKYMTNDWSFPQKALSEQLITSESFRTAWAAAGKLRGDHPEQPIDVRHFMAAYAVCPQYHLLDFLRLRIDRRAWCLELADHLREKYPAEDVLWQAYARLAAPIPLLEFNSDAPEGRDLLNINREVEAFAQLIAARTTHTPLSIGVFGAWGSGKSFFMRRVRERVARLGEIGDDPAGDSHYYDRIAQIEFNAWHYSEGSLIACLVDHIFRNLRIGVEDEDEATLRRRSAELIVQLDQTKQILAEREQGVEKAEQQRLAAQRELAEIEAQIPAEIANQRKVVADAQRKVADTASELAKAEDRKTAEIERAVAVAPIRAAADVLRTGIGNQNVEDAERAVQELVGETKSGYPRWVPILLGLVVLAIGLLASQIVQSEIYGQVISAITAIGTVAAAAKVWLNKLNAIADKGEEFQKAQAKIAAAAAEAVEARYKPELAELTQTLTSRRDALDEEEKQLKALLSASDETRGYLEKLDQAHARAVAQYEQATAEVAAQQDALSALGHQSLLAEFLDDRAMTDGYRKNLTIFTQVRNDFERLSKLMTLATKEHAEDRNKPTPTVNRIVLYIDDLDRCPEDKVIEVLRTVHLLLAFPLFVCVVAVDPRWVSRSLQNAPGLLGNDRWQVGGTQQAAGAVDGHSEVAQQLEETFGKPATPADYLEKIFQIPLWLRPVPAAQRPDIVRALFDPKLDRSKERLTAPVITALTATSSVPTVTDSSAEEGAVVEMVEKIRPHQPKDASKIDRRLDSATEGSLSAITIDSVELDYIGELGGLLDGNPRALKRFVNTYRLVKSSLSDIELEVFRSELGMLGDVTGRARYAPYRLCMAQLAVLCTQRERALRMVRFADERPETLGAWLDRIAEKDAELARLFRCMLPEDFPDPKQIPFDTFALWLERTRRYSFYL